MRKRTAVRGLILGCAVACTVAAAVFTAITHAPKTPFATVESSAARAPAVGYIVGQWEGLLAVYAADGGQPLEIFDVYIASLPPEERVRLTAGIPAVDDVALARLLEDYTG